MPINFKIYFEQNDNGQNKIVLLKGELTWFNWKSLKEKIIENSNHLYYKSKNLEINDNDIFVLKIIEVSEKNYKDDIKEIFDERTFNYLLVQLKELKNLVKVESIMIKFNLVKVKEIPQTSLPDYDIILDKALNKFWKIEKEHIMNELAESELTKSNTEYLNKFYIENKPKSKINKNILCNRCSKINFCGPRYVCIYCNNFNLCYTCYKTDEHEPKHNFIIIKEPIESKESIIKYNNIINPNIQIFHNIKSSFNIKFNLINTGENDLKDCFINYIRFDDNNLICNKYIIKEEFKRNSTEEIELEIKFNDISDNYFFDYEGHFRMFNRFGIPFGNILIVKLHNNFLRKI